MESTEIKRILVAVDESPRSFDVVKKAIAFAATFKADVVLLHIRQKVPDILGHPYYQQVLDSYMKKAELTTEPLATLLREAGVDHEVLILEDDPAESIIEAAQDERCDMIIMGTRGLSNLKGIALGSVSNKVLHLAHCMVLVVP